MSTLQDAADELKRFSVRMRAILLVAEELDRIGSIDQAANEAQSRLDRARVLETEAKASIGQAQETAAGIKAQADQALVDARVEASGIIEAAKAAAKKLSDDAKAKTDKRIADASDRAASIDAQTETKSAELLKLTETIKSANSELDRINGVIAEARARLGG